jgi:MFS family permease
MVEFRSQLLSVGTFSALLAVVRSGRTILIPLVGLSLQLDIVSISLGVTASFVCGVCMFPFSGIIMDRFGRRVNGSISLLIFGCGLVLLGFARTFDSFVAAAALCGLGNGFSSGLVMTLGGDLANLFDDEENRGPFLGVYKLVCDIGGVSGPLIAGVVTNVFDTSISSFLFAIFAIVALLWLRCVVKETRPKKTTTATKEEEEGRHTIDTARIDIEMQTKENVGKIVVMTSLLGLVNHGYSLTWFKKILSYVGPNERERYELRCSCLLFRNALKPSSLWTMFPQPNHPTLNSLLNMLNEKLNTADPEEGRLYSNLPKWILLSKGTHLIERDESLMITYPLKIYGAGKNNTIIQGGNGFRLKNHSSDLHFDKKVVLNGMTVLEAEGDGVYASVDISLLCENMLFRKCKGNGVYVRSTKGRLRNCVVKECGESGIFSGVGGLIELEGHLTKVYGNVKGLQVMKNSSSIHLLAPLTKETVSIKNRGGLEYGCYGAAGFMTYDESSGGIKTIASFELLKWLVKWGRFVEMAKQEKNRTARFGIRGRI